MTDHITLTVKLPGFAASRKLQIAANDDLHSLAYVICRAFDFEFDHAFGFYSETNSRRYYNSKRKYEKFADAGQGSDGALPVSGTPVLEAFPKIGSKMLYLFDYGDDWHFIVTRDKPPPGESTTPLPRIVASRGKAPIQYPEPED